MHVVRKQARPLAVMPDHLQEIAPASAGAKQLNHTLRFFLPHFLNNDPTYQSGAIF
jgi:hypothetical protein